jgi:hypothetical protein
VTKTSRCSWLGCLRIRIGRHRTAAAGGCNSHSLQIPILLALPYVLRFIQCIIIFRNNKDVGQFFNAVKYTTALPVVYFSYIKYSVPLVQWRTFWKPLWVVAAAVNTGYSFYWDVERDWDIRLFHRGVRPCRRLQRQWYCPPLSLGTRTSSTEGCAPVRTSCVSLL